MGAIKTGWDFFQDQILGMHWLKDLIGNLLVKAGMGESRFPGEFLHFFIYDVIKIFVLLAVLIFLISYIQSYFPPERSKKIMGRFHGVWANIIGALLGTVTPFCSCSSIPIFMGFTSAGLPLGVTFSFLISSPMVDLGSLVLLMSVFGGKIAFAYVIVGLIVAVVGGTLIEKLHMEDQVEEFIRQAQNVEIESPKLTVGDRMNYAKNHPEELLKMGVNARKCVENTYCEESCTIHFCWSSNWGGNSQSDSGAYSSKHIRRAEVVCGAAGNGSRSTNVCRYFWNNTGCRKSAGKRGRAWNNSGIYDVCDDYFIPVTGDVVKSN